MSSKESRKQKGLNYKGTIVPKVAQLMNQCAGYGKEFRILTREEYDFESKNNTPLVKERMTIIVDSTTGNYVSNFWG